MLENMKNRRTIRKYTTQDIPDALLNELLEVAARASNTGNMQLYSVVITRDKTNKEKLAPAHFNQPMITAAPVVLTFCADANRFVKWAELRDAVAGFDNFQTFIASTIDAMLFAQSFCTAAEEKGLGICYLGTTAYNADKRLASRAASCGVSPVRRSFCVHGSARNVPHNMPICPFCTASRKASVRRTESPCRSYISQP